MSHPPTPRTVRAVVLAMASALALLVFAPGATAARDPIAGGITDFHLKRGFERKLDNLGVQLTGLGATTVSGKKVAMKVLEGKLDPTDAVGFLDNRGGFKLALGNRGVPVTRITVNTAKRAVYAEIAKARMQLGSLGPYSDAREGFGAKFKATKVFLTEKAVRRISNRLGLRGSKRLNPGRVLSNSYSVAEPETVTVLPQGAATLEGDPASFEKLGSKGVEVPEGISALAPATKPTPTSFALPIAGGTLAPDAKGGTVTTSGGVEIAKEGAATMRLLGIYADFTEKTATVELQILPSPPVPRGPIANLVLTGATVVADPSTRQITVKDAELRLQAAAATTLNDVFNKPEPEPASNFVVGDSFGKLSFTVQAR